nr:hypothetical protein CFP56_04052 [Quercus suber]
MAVQALRKCIYDARDMCDQLSFELRGPIFQIGFVLKSIRGRIDAIFYPRDELDRIQTHQLHMALGSRLTITTLSRRPRPSRKATPPRWTIIGHCFKRVSRGSAAADETV